MTNVRTPLRFFVLMAICFCSLVVAEGTDEQWEITTKMEMKGMPMAMPAMTNKACLPKNRKSNEDLIPKDKDSDCKMSDVKQSGNKTSFKMVCAGKHPMKGDGEIEHSGDNYRGTMHIVGDMDGQPMDMTQSFSGKKIGTCTYEDPTKKALAIQEKMTADVCKQSIDKLQWQVFSNDPTWSQQFAMCKPFKKDFCARVTKVANDARKLDNFKSFANDHRDWKDLLATCDIPSDKLLADVCKQAVDVKDWDVVAESCPVEAKALVAEHCSGRDYTAMISGTYGGLCQRYARRPDRTDPQQAIPTKEDAIKNGVNEGVNKLKKILPF